MPKLSSDEATISYFGANPLTVRHSWCPIEMFHQNSAADGLYSLTHHYALCSTRGNLKLKENVTFNLSHALSREKAIQIKVYIWRGMLYCSTPVFHALPFKRKRSLMTIMIDKGLRHAVMN